MPRPGLREWLAVGRVLAHGDLLRSGRLQTVVRFEQELAQATGAGQALAVSSGTAALVCALQAAGIGPGDEVLVPAYTWMASAGAVALVGAVPVLVEIDESLTLNPADLAARITPRSRAVIPVHMINRPCDMDRILAVARGNRLVVIEDAAQAVGVRYRGRFCGTMGEAGVFSFNQYKNMTCGEGGAILTSDRTLFLRALNAHDMGLGFRDTEHAEDVFVGANYRISEIQGAILRVQLKRLHGVMRRVRKRVILLTEMFRAAGLPVAPHHDPADAMSLAVTFDTEDAAIAFAQNRGVRRLFDNSKHVYTAWEPLLQRRMAHPALDPWDYTGVNTPMGDCPRTLDLLRRSCLVNPLPELPLPMVRLLGQRLIG